MWRFGVTPLFLFSGTFFPIDRLPDCAPPIAWLLPLWHGVDLARGAGARDGGGAAALMLLAHLVILLGDARSAARSRCSVMFKRKLER